MNLQTNEIVEWFTAEGEGQRVLKNVFKIIL